jgi:hypothetical protein
MQPNDKSAYLRGARVSIPVALVVVLVVVWRLAAWKADSRLPAVTLDQDAMVQMVLDYCSDAGAETPTCQGR